MEWDVFISHASEDKESIARPLCRRLQEKGFKVWFDEFTLTIGDSLRRRIDEGLAKSRYGIVIISPNFLQKQWPQWELDGLVAKEVAGEKVILPVWHRVTAETVRNYSPTLADRLAGSSAEGVEGLADRLSEAIKRRVDTKVRPVSEADEDHSNDIKETVYCSRCGTRPGTRSICVGSYINHDFVHTKGTIFYCTRCGSTPGTRSICIGSHLSHSFTGTSAAIAYCSRCGAAPGHRTVCIGSYLNHDFIASNKDPIYCSRCGATPGERTICVGSYLSHNFNS